MAASVVVHTAKKMPLAFEGASTDTVLSLSDHRTSEPKKGEGFVLTCPSSGRIAARVPISAKQP
jgi:hypothetical protein